MKSLKVALLQLLPENTLEGNLHKGIVNLKRAKEMGADIALFPEMWSTGYTIPEATAELEAKAVPADSEFVNSFGQLAKSLNMAIGITFLEEYAPSPRNALCVFDRFGKKVLSYAKVHTCDFSEECRLTAGDDFFTADLDTVQGSVRIGAMICYDREFPESARILMLKGAEIILVPNACPMDFTVFKRENYFLTELLEDEWNTTSGPVKVHFYRRPLSRIVTAVLEAGFLLEKLSEPMPTEEFRAAQPEVYQRLTKRPQFLFLRARKP